MKLNVVIKKMERQRLEYEKLKMRRSFTKIEKEVQEDGEITEEEADRKTKDTEKEEETERKNEEEKEEQIEEEIKEEKEGSRAKDEEEGGILSEKPINKKKEEKENEEIKEADRNTGKGEEEIRGEEEGENTEEEKVQVVFLAGLKREVCAKLRLGFPSKIRKTTMQIECVEEREFELGRLNVWKNVGEAG